MSTHADLRRSRRTRLTLVLAYAAIGIGWILASGSLVALLPAGLHTAAENAKGVAFVLVTGALLWAVLAVRDLRVERERVARLADVTARMKAVEQHRRLAGAIEATPLGVAVLARRGDGFEIAYANEALARLTGVTAAELVGLDPLQRTGLFGPDTAAELGARLTAGESFEADSVVAPRDGQATPVRVLVSPVADPDEATGSVVAIVLDRREAMAREAAEARLGMVLDASPVPIVATDAEGRVTEWNPAAGRAFGWRSEEVIGRPFPLLPQDARDAYDALPGQLARADAAVAVELPLLHRDGRRIHCRLQATTLAASGGSHPPVSGGGGGGARSGLVMTIEDLTGQIEQQHARARLASAIDAAGEAILITDLDGAITYVNPAFERVSGYSHDELLGKNPRILQSGLTSASVYADLWHRLRGGQVWRGVLFNKRKDGSLFEEEATLSPVFGSDGVPIAYVGVKRDLTLERTLAAGLSTELNDRAAVQETMARLDLGETPEETAQLLCQAVAGFQDVGGAVLEHLPAGDGPAIVIGVAGDAARGVRIGDAQDAERSMRLRLRATGGAWSSRQVGAPAPTLPGIDTEDLTTVAAPVRHRGRAVAVLHIGARTDAPDAWVSRYLRVASELAAHVAPVLGPELSRRDIATVTREEVQRLIDTGGFTPLFQPICDLATGAAVGWEAFTRFADGVPPSRRFADAQSLGMGAELELVCGTTAVAAFNALGHDGWLSVNLSPGLLLSGRAGAILAAATQPIVFELTETVAAEDCLRVRDAMDALRQPAMVAVDDTGAGYATLRRVLELRPDFVKLDLGLVHEIDRDTARQALVAGMVHYASQAAAQLIAEGVETEAEHMTLVRLGVQYGQGYLFGAPSTAGTLADQVAGG